MGTAAAQAQAAAAQAAAQAAAAKIAQQQLLMRCLATWAAWEGQATARLANARVLGDFNGMAQANAELSMIDGLWAMYMERLAAL